MLICRYETKGEHFVLPKWISYSSQVIFGMKFLAVYYCVCKGAKESINHLLIHTGKPNGSGTISLFGILCVLL